MLVMNYIIPDNTLEAAVIDCFRFMNYLCAHGYEQHFRSSSVLDF